MNKKIGGFFGLHLEFSPPANSLLTWWGIPQYTHWTFSNGRSALHYLLRYLKPKTFWLPAYSCLSLAEAAKKTQCQLKFFPLNENLSPDCNYLHKHLRSGDVVLVIDYFGRNPDTEFLTLRKKTKNIHWIEDRAQALLPAPQPWGDFILYSPRKLLGVPDGGIVVSPYTKLPKRITEKAILNANFIDPSLLRYEDEKEVNNVIWYKTYVKTEKAIRVSATKMSNISRYILANANPKLMANKRKQNYAALMKQLEEIALLPKDDKGFIPSGFPIRIKDRKKVAAFLHKNDIFAAHHWPELASPAKGFSAEHALAEQILTLPCDYRYDTSDMEHMARLVKEIL